MCIQPEVGLYFSIIRNLAYRFKLKWTVLGKQCVWKICVVTMGGELKYQNLKKKCLKSFYYPFIGNFVYCIFYKSHHFGGGGGYWISIKPLTVQQILTEAI